MQLTAADLERYGEHVSHYVNLERYAQRLDDPAAKRCVVSYEHLLGGANQFTLEDLFGRAVVRDQ